MIAAYGTEGFVPFGRDYVGQHPGDPQLQVKVASASSTHHERGHPLIKSFSTVTLGNNDTSKKESWQFRSDRANGRSDHCEELYVRGNTVVWSRGNTITSRQVVKTFTVESPVLKADWCSFILPALSESRNNGSAAVDTNCVIQRCVAVVEPTSVSIFTETGEDYAITLPFQVTNSWVIQNGLLFERIVPHSEITSPRKNVPNQTTIFSMLHPLDEVAPVITRTVSGATPKISYLTDTSQHVVFTSLYPSLALTYDTMVGVHSVWNVRRAKQEEINSAVGLWDNTGFYYPGIGTPVGALNQSRSNNSRFTSTLSSQSPSMSPLSSFSGHQLNSPIGLSRSRSPAYGFLPPSRNLSPNAGTGNMFRIDTPSPGLRSPAAFHRTPVGGGHNVSLINESRTEWVEPLAPDICMDQLWTETPPTIRDGPLGQATKAFLSQDICGQKYICFLVAYRNQLRCVKLGESNDRSQLIFGSMSTVPAKDAVPVQELSLILILDLYGHVILYSGTTRIHKVHIPELPVDMTPVILSRTATPVASPQRGLVTSSRPSSAVDPRFGEGGHMISPVQSDLENSPHIDTSITEEFPPQGKIFIRGIRDSVNRAFTVELMSGDMYRATLPAFAVSPGIELCLNALRQILPRDTAVQVLGKWYSTRNSLGGIGNQSEWAVFIKALLNLMGYDTGRLALTNQGDLDVSMSPVVASKRARPSDQGSDEDWEYLLDSSHHEYVCEIGAGTLGLSPPHITPEAAPCNKLASINTSALLFPHMPAITFALHLVYEEMKLSTLSANDSQELVHLLFQLASDLQLSAYTDYYCRDLPALFDAVDEITQVKDDHLKKMQFPGYLTDAPTSVCGWIYQSVRGLDCPPIPYIPDVCLKMKNIISVYSLLLNEDLTISNAVEKSLKRIVPSGHRAPPVSTNVSLSRSFSVGHMASVAERIVLFMTELGLTNEDLESLPVGVALPLREAMFVCRHNPPADWPEKAHCLIGRQDLTMLAGGREGRDKKSCGSSNPPSVSSAKEEEDGIENMDQELLRLRFSEDLRVQEVRRMLQSARPARITVTQRPEVSDHDFIEEQERHLYSICIRTMGLPVGRGMFTMCSHVSVTIEALPIPNLCLTGRAPPRNTTVELKNIDTPYNMAALPHFHNGVAAGLRIADSSQVNSPWIIYNKPKSNELANEYAGFLMALGLNGHLVNLNVLTLHDSLAKGHEMTSVGLLLGLSAAKRGTMDNGVTRLLSVHLSALLPPTSTELNVPHNVQVASVLGVGLVYQGTAHRHIAEVLLSEIGRPPGPEMENCMDRESYSLAAGLALGLVMFGKGSESVGLSDLSMADQLCHYMIGGHRRPLTGVNKDRYKSPSYQIKEGDVVNVDVTSPGATLALGMVFFNTNNSAVAAWLSAPDTQFLLDHVRPDFLLLRTLSQGLILWDKIQPSSEWVHSHLPEIVSKYAFMRNQVPEDADLDIDFETMSQAFSNITAGACMALGLKFAGSCNMAAFKALFECLNKSLTVLRNPAFCEQAGKNTVENCMIVILLSAAMVMAGSGNLDLLRVCRMLRKRVGPQYNYSLYGYHMAVSMAIGLLFLGGGRYTLSTRPEAIGPMLCAFFPKFPLHSNDNRYHLQAFRHLFVLSAEPRLILPKDVDSGLPCYVPVHIKFKDTEWYKDVSFKATAPCLLPELHLLEEVQILGPRYWPVVFSGEKSFITLRNVLESSGVLYVKQRAGHLSYCEDPKGYRSMLAKSLTSDQSSHGSVKPEVIKSFTSDENILAFTKYFTSTTSNKERALVEQLSRVLYDCVTREKPEALGTHIALDQAVRGLQDKPSAHLLWQIKLVLAYYSSHFSRAVLGKTQHVPLVHEEFLYGLKSQVETDMDAWEKDRVKLLVRYLQGEVLTGNNCSHLSLFLLWFDIPRPDELRKILITGTPTLPQLCQSLPHVPVETILKILTAWQAAR